MDQDTLLTYLNTKPEAAELARQAGDDPDLLEGLFALARTRRSPVRYLCTKAVRLLSETRPRAICPYFDEVAGWLRDANSFVKWDGILTLANLAADAGDRFAGLYEEYFGLLHDPQMVTAANVAGNAWKIALANPRWEPDITRRLLEVPGIVYLHHGEPSPECNRVMCGHVLDCFEHYFDRARDRAAMLRFAQSQLDCPRKAVAKSAARFLRRHAAPGAAGPD